jgi:hypothetical protein
VEPVTGAEVGQVMHAERAAELVAGAAMGQAASRLDVASTDATTQRHVEVETPRI